MNWLGIVFHNLFWFIFYGVITISWLGLQIQQNNLDWPESIQYIVILIFFKNTIIIVFEKYHLMTFRVKALLKNVFQHRYFNMVIHIKNHMWINKKLIFKNSRLTNMHTQKILEPTLKDYKYFKWFILGVRKKPKNQLNQENKKKNNWKNRIVKKNQL